MDAHGLSLFQVHNAEMFPTAQRTASFGIPYAVAIAAFGGTAGMVLAAVGNP